MVKAIFFDFGEVFVTSNSKVINEQIKAEFGVSFIRSDLLDTYLDYVRGKISTEDYFLEILKKNGCDMDVNTLIKRYSELYAENLVVDKDMFGLLDFLKGKYKLVCFSDMNELHRKINQEKGFFDKFELLIFSHETKKLKIDNYFEEVIKKMNLSPKEVIFVDDREMNTAVAESVGISSIVFTNFKELLHQFQKFGININNT